MATGTTPPARPRPSGRFDPVPRTLARALPATASRSGRASHAEVGRPLPTERLLAGPGPRPGRLRGRDESRRRQNVLFTLVLTVVISGIGTLTLAWPLFKLLLLAGLLLLAVYVWRLLGDTAGRADAHAVGCTRSPRRRLECSLRTASGFCRPRSCRFWGRRLT